MVQDGGGRKLNNAGKVLVIQIIGGVQAAASEDSVLNAGGQEVPKAHFQIEVVQFFQQTAPCIIGEVGQMVAVVVFDGTADLFHDVPANVRLIRRTILPL